MRVICIATPKQLKNICSSGFFEQYGIYEAEEQTYQVSPSKFVKRKDYRIKLDHIPNHFGYTIDMDKKYFKPYNEWLALEREKQIKVLFE
jgi:hypothetical protein